MDHKQLILSTLRGEPTNVLPFIPRLDIKPSLKQEPIF